MANDPLTGLISDDSAQSVVDYLGRSAPLSFTGQPALPAGAPAPSPSAAPAGAGGVGATPASSVKSATAPKGPDAPSFFDPGIFTGGGGVGGEGSGSGAPGGQGPAGSVPGIASPGFDFGPFSVGVTGQVGLSTGAGKAVDVALNTATQQALGRAGLPTSIPALIAMVAQSPVMSGIASLFSIFGIPVTAVNLAHMFAGMSPTSVTSLQAALADPNPESQISPEQAMAIVAGKQMGPVAGSPMTQGTLGFSPPNTATAQRGESLATGRGVDDPGQPGVGPGPGPGPSSAPPGEAGPGGAAAGAGTGAGTSGEGSGASGPGGDAAW